MENPFDEIWKAGEESKKWLEAYAASLPIIRAQDVVRAVSDPDWLNEENLRRRAKHRAKVARLRAKARAKDLEGFRRTEREGRARRRRAERDRDGGRAAEVRAATRIAILKTWPTGSEAVTQALSSISTPRRRSEGR